MADVRPLTPLANRVLRSLVGFERARDLTKGEGPMELAKLLEHNAQASALTPRGQLRVVGAPMRTLCVLIRSCGYRVV
jgi:hypothetical protein